MALSYFPKWIFTRQILSLHWLPVGSFLEKTFYYQLVSRFTPNSPPSLMGDEFTYQKSMPSKQTGLGGASSQGVKQVLQCALLPGPSRVHGVRASLVFDKQRHSTHQTAENILIKAQGFLQFLRNDKSETFTLLPEVLTRSLQPTNLALPTVCL